MPTLLTSAEWTRLQEIFDAAVELFGEERSDYLNRACANAPELRHRVELLIASFEAETKLGGMVGAAASQTLEVALPAVGGRLGDYRITAILGRGGMGVVYRATRDDAEYEKDVAIKVAVLSSFAGDFRERFLRERQILADLDHPHIARLLDGGTTADGLPFVVMEYVPGKPIDAFCDDAALDRHARVRLMVIVARAVDYAHQHLVVHRDLKPDNIHITAEGEPKLLDFGIAKALDQEAKGIPGTQTVDGARLMTPDYASPEQVRGQAITTATDVYQLGILLYQLLTGARPFKPTASMGEMERAICESIPSKPNLDADLDRILLHSLEKEPSRRYASAGALANDLERYLSGYPILARAPSWPYLTAKFARRHRLGVGAASLFLLLLTSFGVGMAILARRASQQARIANQTTAFLLGLFEANDPEQGRGDKITARELLDKGAANLNGSAGQDPIVQVSLLDSIGTIYNYLGDSDKAKEMLYKSLRIRHEHLAKDDLAEADTLARLADVESDLSHFDQSLQLNQRALATYRSRSDNKPGGEDKRIAIRLQRISSDYWEQDNMPQAEAYEREAMELSTRLVGRHDERTLEMIGDMGVIVDIEGKVLEAEPYFKEYLSGEEELNPQNVPNLGHAWNCISWLHYRLGRLADSEQDMRNALALRIRAFGEKHWVTAGAQTGLAYILLSRGKADEALALATEAKETDVRIYGLIHRETAFADDSLGLALLAKGHTALGRQQLELALKARLILLPPNHMQTAKSWMFLAMADFAADDLPLAEEEIRKSIAITQRVYPPHGHPQLAEFDAVLLEILVAQHKLPEAEELGRQSATSFRRILTPQNPRLSAILSGQAWALYRDGKFDQAVPLLREALSIDTVTFGPGLNQTARTGIRLAACLLASGKQQEARELMGKYRAQLLASPDGTYHEERAWLRAHASANEPSLAL